MNHELHRTCGASCADGAIVSGSVLAPVVREGVRCRVGLVGDGGGLSSPSSENTWMIGSSWNLRRCGGSDGPAQGLIIGGIGVVLSEGTCAWCRGVLFPECSREVACSQSRQRLGCHAGVDGNLSWLECVGEMFLSLFFFTGRGRGRGCGFSCGCSCSWGSGVDTVVRELATREMGAIVSLCVLAFWIG